MKSIDNFVDKVKSNEKGENKLQQQFLDGGDEKAPTPDPSLITGKTENQEQQTSSGEDEQKETSSKESEQQEQTSPKESEQEQKTPKENEQEQKTPKENEQQQQEQQKTSKENEQQEQSSQKETEPKKKEDLSELFSSIDGLLDELSSEKKNKDEDTEEENVNDNQELSLEKQDGINNIVDKLKEKNLELEMKLKESEMRQRLLEQQLENKEGKESEIYEKYKNLERDLKKIKSDQIHDEISPLNDYYKLYKESDTIYNERNVLGSAVRLIEDITQMDMTDYLMDYYKKGGSFNSEEGSVTDTNINKNDDKKEKNPLANSFI